VSHPATCSTCRYQPDPVAPRSDRRLLISVVDELGKSAVCSTCFVMRLSQLRSTADITVFMARPTAAVA
jgi:hypothetical protein